MDPRRRGRGRGSSVLAPNRLTSQVNHSLGSGTVERGSSRGRGRANPVGGVRGRPNASRGQGRGTAGHPRPPGRLNANAGVQASAVASASGSSRGNSGSQRSGHRGGIRGAAGPSRPLGRPYGFIGTGRSSSSRSRGHGAAGPRPTGHSGTSSSNRGHSGAAGSYRGGRGGGILISNGIRQGQRSTQPLGLDRLCEFLGHPDFAVIQCIYKDLDGWKALLKEDPLVQDRSVRRLGGASGRGPSQSSDDKLHLVVYILGEKVCSETTALGTAQMEVLAASVICEVFMKKVMNKFVSLNVHGPEGQQGNTKPKVLWDLVRFLRCLATIARFMSKTMKTSAVSFVTQIYAGVIGMFGAWQMMGRTVSDKFEAVKKDFSDLHNEKEEWQTIINHQKNQAKQYRRMCFEELREAEMEKVHQDLMAVENIRCIPIVPDAYELLSNEIPFIRPLKVTGAYKDAATYLDIHFRLLREDLVRPLRDGIQEYLKSLNSNSRGKRLKTNLRIYPDVELLETEEVKGVQVQYVKLSDRSKRIQWDKSKRLLNGNLLVLTPNNFRTALFAMVHIRDARQLQSQRRFGITWHGSSMYADLRKWDSFLMVESEVYFEAYKHTLEILQTLPLESFRMSKFIVNVSTEVGPPAYLKPSSTSMEIGKRQISPLDLSKWPTAAQLKLDGRQYAAYQACLTREFVIVQGPPGTGKTFLGLQVVETLLKNQKLWHCPAGKSSSNNKDLRRVGQGDFGGPILVVCYTNHALDQFLEGIFDVFSKLKQSPNMVRVGGNGKSSNEAMKTLSLYERRKIWLAQRRGYLEVMELKKAASELRKLEQDYAYATTELQYLKRSAGLVALKELRFKDILLKLNGEVPGFQIQKWLESCSSLEYFGYDPYVFTSTKQNIQELIYQRFDVRDHSTANVANETEVPLRKHVTSEHHIADVDDGSDHEDYDLDELMQKRLIEDDDDEDFTVTVIPNMLHGVDMFKIPLSKARDTLAEHEKTLSVFLKLSPRPKDPPLELTMEQQACETEVSNYQALLKPTSEQRAWDAEAANYRTLIATARQSLSSLLAFESYVSRIFNLKRNNKLRDFQISLGQISHVTHYRQLSEELRWGVYFLLRQKAIDVGNTSLLKKRDAARNARNHWQDLRNEVDGKLLNESLVVGMTTTGAAKYNNLLKKAQSKIVIVEEAAEVLESHLVTCITPACQQLILIGDHQQLRPSTSVYELSQKYKLDISLFERMVKNNLNCSKLEVQHRMRPEIADLIVGTIYDRLKNAPVVQKYPAVKGVTSNLFFLSHGHAENGVEESKSKSNEFEAVFLIAFCYYLMQQDYSPSQITILTTYSGQMFLLKKLQRENNIPSEVRITTVDNYQGEENDIILLSLVRSNEAGNIGFLRTDNRVCVALSRAKHGLFILGNIDQLSQKSQTWEAIRQKLQKRQEIGTSLRIRCEVHSTVNEITAASQFRELAPNGGCREYCLTPLKCSHICSSICHPQDREHKEYRCPQPCTKSCIRSHPCKAKCHEKCPQCFIKVKKLFPECGHQRAVPCHLFDTPLNCTTLVNKELACKHFAEMACYMDPAEYLCPIKVVKELLCGHTKKVACYKKNDPLLCRSMVEKTLLCEHKQMERCHVPVEDVKCMTDVEVQFPVCGHSAKKKCHVPVEDVKCMSDVEVQFPVCGHSAKKKCHVPIEDVKCMTDVEVRFPVCGHTTKKKCHVPIQDVKCMTDVGVRFASCMHMIKKKCHSTDRPKCNGPCSTKLDCGHICVLSCHALKDPEHLHYKCQKPCTRLCEKGHKCKQKHPCSTPCIPCQAQVKLPCGHQKVIECRQNPASITCLDDCNRQLSACGHKCQNKCSEDCGPCQMLTRSACGHNILAKCGDPNSSSPDCTIPALLKSPCGHEVAIPCGKRFEVSRLKLEEYCTAPGCGLRVPQMDQSDLGLSKQFLPDHDSLATGLEQLSLKP